MNDEESLALQLETLRQRMAERARSGSGSHGSSPVPAGDVVEKLLARKGLARRFHRLAAIELWPEVVGDKIAAASRAVRVQESTLVVEVRSSAWMNELNLMRREILSRLNERLEGAEIERVMFVLAEGGPDPREGIRRGRNG